MQLSKSKTTQMLTGAKLDYSHFFRLCNGISVVSVKVERVGGTILKTEQRVRRNSQWVKAIYCLGLITLERVSKLNGSWRKQDGSVKWIESVQTIYIS